MNARLAKESRQLLPATLFGSGLLLASAFAGESARIPMMMMAYWVACCLLAAAPFAGHHGLGEMSAQLAHPISRETIWREKLRITFRAMFAIGGLFALLICVCMLTAPRSSWLPVAVGSLIAAPLFTLPLGFWIMLRVGDERAAVLLNLVAAMLYLPLTNGVAILLGTYTLTGTGITLVVLTGLIAPFLFRGARTRLTAWEDHQPLRQEYSMTLPAAGDHRRTRSWANWRALILKELHLQQTNGLFVGGLLICGAAVRVGKEPELSLVAMMSLITLFGPMMLGLGAVCEEHRLGVHAEQTVRPAGVNRQWFTKFFVCLLAATTLGWLLALAARELMPTTRGSTINLMPLGTIDQIAGRPFADGSLLHYLLGSAFGVALGMAAGAVFRSYLRSITALLIFYFATGWIVTSGAHRIAEALWLNEAMYPELVLLVVAGSIGLAVLLIGKLHYAVITQTRQAIRRHVAMVALVFVLGWGAAHATYLRAWEFVTLPRPTGPALVSAEQVAGFLPDLMRGRAVDHQGRLWTTHFRWEVDDHLEFKIEDTRPIWKQAAGSDQLIFGLQTNGTLWVRGSRAWEERYARWTKHRYEIPTFTSEITQFGNDSDWSSVVGRLTVFHALKQDGTLWSWGANIYGQFGLTNRHKLWPEPKQIGDANDWIQIAVTSRDCSNYALKSDGTLWRWGTWTNPNASNKDDRYLHAVEPEPLNNPLDGRIVRLRTTPSELMAILDDDTVIIFNLNNYAGPSYDAAATTPMRRKRYPYPAAEHKPTRRVDRRVFHWNSIYHRSSALTVNGTAIQQRYLPYRDFFRGPIGPPGAWVSYAGDSHRQLMLKADGTLWHAGSPITPYEDWWRRDDKRLIPPRWRPKQIGRLFPTPEADWPR